MAGYVLRNCKIYFDGYDISGYLNQVTLEAGSNAQSNTTFGSNTETFISGLQTVSLSLAGWVESAAAAGANNYRIEENSWNAAGSTANKIMMIIPTSFAQNQPVYWFPGAQGAVQQGGAVGAMYAYSGKFAATGQRLCRGMVIDASTYAATTRSTTGAVCSALGAPNSGQLTYAAVACYLLASSSASVTVTIQSATAATFASPTTQFTFTAQTGNPSAQMAAAPVSCSTAALYWRTSVSLIGRATDLVGVLAAVGHM